MAGPLDMNIINTNQQQAQLGEIRQISNTVRVVCSVALGALALVCGAFGVYIGASLLGAPILLATSFHVKIVTLSVCAVVVALLASSSWFIYACRDPLRLFVNADLERRIEHLEQQPRL